MKIEIRKSFTKDADKLPAPFRRHLAEIIKAIEKSTQPSQLADCKKLTGYKTAYRIRMGNIASVFIMRIKQLSLFEYSTEKRSTVIFHKNYFKSPSTLFYKKENSNVTKTINTPFC